jgi:lactoylglutathione lyase
MNMAEQRVVGVGVHVTDLDRSVEFYTSVLGMKEVARYEFEGITEVLVGFGDLGGAATVVLVDRAEHPGPYDMGTGFDRVLLMVDDVDATCERLRAFGCEVTKEPGASAEVPVRIAMAQDPDGYGLELIEQPGPLSGPSERR